MTRYYWILLGAFAGVWSWSAIGPVYARNWILENMLVLAFVPVILLLGRYLKLSNLSYTLITVFMILHLVGAHYTYEKVPFGFVLQGWLGASRNMYDRLVHFSFGLLLAYPVREMFMRVARVKGFWSFYLPLDVTLAFSAAYEIIEWLVAANVDAAAGLAFLGSQGDIWDAQKDMLMAGVGACVAMTAIMGVNWKYNPEFWREMRESFTIRPHDEPMGEALLKKWQGG